MARASPVGSPRLEAVDHQIDLDVTAFQKGRTSFRPGRRAFSGSEVQVDLNLVEGQAGGVEGAETFGDVCQPEMARAVVAEFLEQFRLLRERSLFGILHVHAEGKKRIRRG